MTGHCHQPVAAQCNERIGSHCTCATEYREQLKAETDPAAKGDHAA